MEGGGVRRVRVGGGGVARGGFQPPPPPPPPQAPEVHFFGWPAI